MKPCIVVLIFIIVFSSCEKDDSSQTYPGYLKNRFIQSICFKDDYKFILSSRGCDTCYVPLDCSYRPSIDEVSIVNGSVIKNCMGSLSSSILKANCNSDIYLLQGKTLYLISETGNSTEVLNTGKDQFFDFTFDQAGNIWLLNNDKLAFWDRNDLILYSAKDSLTAEENFQGLTVDFTGEVWVCTDYNLIQIDAGKWTRIPYTQLEGMEDNTRLYNPKATVDNSIWFQPYYSSEKGIMRYKDGVMGFSRPDTTKYISLLQDQEGTLWANCRHYGFNEKGNTILLYSTLRYFHNEAWVDVDVSDIKQYINTVNVSESKIYIGTNSGIVERTRKQE